jgi:hypothetical protein
MGLPVRPAKSRDGQARQAEPPEGPGHSPPVCLGGSGDHAGRAVQGCAAPDGQVRAGLRRQPATEDLSGPVPGPAAVGQIVLHCLTPLVFFAGRPALTWIAKMGGRGKRARMHVHVPVERPKLATKAGC